jgi:hypothetical protein
MFSLCCLWYGDGACFDVDAFFQVFAVYHLYVTII